MRILFTDRALPTVIVYRVYIEYIYRALPTAHRSVVAGAGGGGGGRHQDQNNGSLRIYFGVQIPPFIDWTCAGEKCGATVEITKSLQIDLVLSDAAATSEP